MKESEAVKINAQYKHLDITPFLVYMLNVIDNAMNSAIAAQNELLPDEGRLLIKIKKHIGAEITVDRCADILEITKERAYRLLQGMVDKGYLEKYENVYRPKV